MEGTFVMSRAHAPLCNLCGDRNLALAEISPDRLEREYVSWKSVNGEVVERKRDIWTQCGFEKLGPARLFPHIYGEHVLWTPNHWYKLVNGGDVI